MTYACRDCDTTFTAPTDTDTVRCPGCGDMVEQQPAESSPPPDQTADRDRGAKAEALLLHFTAEAHRRKWNYDRGLDDDGQPVRSEAFDALHRLGDEMNVELHKLRAAPAAPPPADRSAVLLEARDVARAEAERLEMSNHDARAARGARSVAYLLRRLAAEAQQPEPGPVARVRALHQPDGNGECQHCHHSAPCPTITALDGAETQQQPDTEQLVCVCGAPAVQYGDRWGHEPGTGEACLYRPYARPRCPECRMPHDLTPGMARVCASILASIADRDAVEGSAAADTSEETCDGCGHTPHPADQCQSFTFNERCECDEPITVEGAQL